MRVPGLTACIITRNEAARIGDCLAAVSFCDEIVVIDAHSSDATREIAARLGARVIERDWPGYRSQKQYATDAATHDWVLSVDADERVTPALRAEIEALRDSGFTGARGWNRHIRLYDRRAARWTGYEVHEKIIVSGPVGALGAPLEHYAYRDLDDQLVRLDRYASLMAAQMYAAGRRCGLLPVLLNPPWRLLRGLLIKGGLLDGWRGWLFHIVEAGYVRRKYLRLWALSRGLKVDQRHGSTE